MLGHDQPGFIRHGIVQATHGSYDEELVELMIRRLPEGRELVAGWEAISRDDHRMDELLAGVDVPLLLSQHKGCLISTDEGFDDAVAAFPQARTISVGDAPTSSEEFADALHEFCEDVVDA